MTLTFTKLIEIYKKNYKISAVNVQRTRKVYKKKKKVPKKCMENNSFYVAHENKMLFLPLKFVRFKKMVGM